MDKNQFQMRVKLKSGLIGRAAYYCEDTVFIYSFSTGTCPEDYLDVDNVECVPDRNNCTMINGVKKCRGLESECPENATFFKAHGPLTGYCILSDR